MGLIRAQGWTTPGSYSALQAWFPDDEACLAYLERLRWREGFVCPACGVMDEPWSTARGQRMCRSCGRHIPQPRRAPVPFTATPASRLLPKRRQTAVTAGTVFAKFRVPLPTWFAGAWYVTKQRFSASGLGLQRVLGLGS